MSPGDEPTNWDIVRRLTEIESDHKDLARTHAADMRDIHQQLSTAKDRSDDKFVRKDVYAEARKADAAVVADLAGDVREVKNRFTSDDAFRRQVWLGLGLTAIASLTSIIVAVIAFVVR